MAKPESQYGVVAKSMQMDPGDRKLASLMHRMATDPNFPLSEIPDRYQDETLVKVPAGVSVVEVPQPEVREVDATEVVKVPKQAEATADDEPASQDEVVSGLLLD